MGEPEADLRNNVHLRIRGKALEQRDRNNSRGDDDDCWDCSTGDQAMHERQRVRYWLVKQDVIENKFKRPGPQEIGKRQQQSADGGNRKPAFDFHQVLANDFIKSSSGRLSHQSGTPEVIRDPFWRIIDHLRPIGAAHPSTVQKGTVVLLNECG
jgi:hypothetical protein